MGFDRHRKWKAGYKRADIRAARGDTKDWADDQYAEYEDFEEYDDYDDYQEEEEHHDNPQQGGEEDSDEDARDSGEEAVTEDKKLHLTHQNLDSKQVSEHIAEHQGQHQPVKTWHKDQHPPTEQLSKGPGVMTKDTAAPQLQLAVNSLAPQKLSKTDINMQLPSTEPVTLPQHIKERLAKHEHSLDVSLVAKAGDSVSNAKQPTTGRPAPVRNVPVRVAVPDISLLPQARRQQTHRRQGGEK